MIVDPAIQMWVTFGVVLVALFFYASEKAPIGVTSIAVIAGLLVFFHLFPVVKDGANQLDAARLVAGFANPALIAVASLLVVGQGLVRTGLLEQIARPVVAGGSWLRLIAVLVAVAILSGIMNNTPVVVVLIPIMQALAERMGKTGSDVLMPLSFAAILGGMTTLVGSSTNLLVSGAFENAGGRALTFFEFTVPGLILMSVGLIYVIFVLPRLLPRREEGDTGAKEPASGRHFLAEIRVGDESALIGLESRGGMFPDLSDLTVRFVERNGTQHLPPFDDIEIQEGDVVAIAGTRRALAGMVHRSAPLAAVDTDEGEEESEQPTRAAPDQVLAEVMVTPGSGLTGQALSDIGFSYRFNLALFGIQRRARMVRERVPDIRLEPGDVLLVQGAVEDARALRGHPDILLMEWSATDVASPDHGKRALAIFLAVIATTAVGLVPISIAGFAGAFLMIATGCLNLRQAIRSIDRDVVLLIAAALAMGAAMFETGGAAFIAATLVDALDGASPQIILSLFFIVVALLTNVLSNNACAVLFTPIGVGLAQRLQIDPMIFAIAVVFAANCSFASPIGYQTNLLVMGPGRYRFADFARGGIPLIILIWLTFSLVIPWYFGL